jgi:hypothetical protein
MKLPPFQGISIAVMAKRAARKAGISPFKDPKSIQVKYVRYADDSLPGIAGYANLVRGIWDRITKFLWNQLRLEVSMATRAKHIAFSKATFLGMRIKVPSIKNWPRISSK